MCGALSGQYEHTANENGYFSSGKKTKHIKVKFFYIKDRVDNREMQVID
jgi:hypothetical protein